MQLSAYYQRIRVNIQRQTTADPIILIAPPKKHRKAPVYRKGNQGYLSLASVYGRVVYLNKLHSNAHAIEHAVDIVAFLWLGDHLQVRCQYLARDVLAVAVRPLFFVCRNRQRGGDAIADRKESDMTERLI